MQTSKTPVARGTALLHVAFPTEVPKTIAISLRRAQALLQRTVARSTEP
jgi:hypothetical protein